MPDTKIIVDVYFDVANKVLVTLWDSEDQFGMPIASAEAATADEAIKAAFETITVTPPPDTKP